LRNAKEKGVVGNLYISGADLTIFTAIEQLATCNHMLGRTFYFKNLRGLTSFAATYSYKPISVNPIRYRESSLSTVLHKSFMEVNRSFERWFSSKKAHTPLPFSSGNVPTSVGDQ
jgi:hypothetical protein